MADKSAALRVIISAVDGLSPVLTKINASVARFRGAQPHVRALNKGLADMGNAARNATSGILPLVGLGGLSIAGLGVGFMAASRGAMAYSASVQDASDATGEQVEQQQKLQGLFRLGGMEAESANDAIVKFNKGIGEAAAGKDKSFAALMKAMNVPLRNARGEINTLSEVLPLVAQSFERTTSPAMRTRMAMELFGKSGAKLIGTLSQGKDSIREIFEDLESSGRILSAGALGGLDKLDEQLEELGVQSRVLSAEIMSAAAPALLKLITGLRGWIAANRGLLQQQIAPAIRSIADGVAKWVQSGGFTRLTDQVRLLVRVIGEWSDRLGGLMGVLKLIGILILAGPVASIVQLIAATVRFAILAAPMAVKAMGMLLAASGPLLVRLGQLAMVLGGALVRGLVMAGQAVLFLGRAMLFNPIGLAVTAIAAAALLIYQNWDKVGPWFEALWRGIQTAFDGALKWFDLLLGAWNPLRLVIAAWDPVLRYFSGLWDKVKAFAGPIIRLGSSLWSGISSAAPAPMVGAGMGGLESPAAGPTPLARAGALGGQQRVQGEMTVRFENAPPGMRVDPGKTNAPGLDFNPDVGYRYMGVGGIG